MNDDLAMIGFALFWTVGLCAYGIWASYRTMRAKQLAALTVAERLEKLTNTYAKRTRLKG